MRNYHPILISILLNLLWIPSNAQQYLFDAQLITTDDGLSSLLTRSVHKDKKGFMWIGTQYGLDRYDGYTFKLYTKEKNGLYKNGGIDHIEEDGEGNLWLFHSKAWSLDPELVEMEAVDIFDPITERAVPFEVYFGDKAPFKVSDIKVTQFNDPQKRIWVTTGQGQLFLYGQGSFKKIFEREGAYFPCITIDNKGHIWMGREDNLLCIDGSGQVLEQFTLPGRVYRIWAGNDDTVWLATTWPKTDFNELHFWFKTKESKQLKPFIFSGNTDFFKLKKPVRIFIHRSEEGYWYLNVNQHNHFDPNLHVFNDKGEWLFDFHTLLGKDSELQVLHHYEDSRYLWLPTETGVLKTSVATNPFHLVHGRKGFSDCRGITGDGAGNIIFLNKQIFQWDPRSHGLRQLSHNSGSYALTYTDSLLWAGTYGGPNLGFQLDLKTNQETIIPGQDRGLPIYAVLKTRMPHRFLIGRGKGLAFLTFIIKKLSRSPNTMGLTYLKLQLFTIFIKMHRVSGWLPKMAFF